MIKVEIKSYTWKGEKGENYRSDFYPFVDGIPRHDIDCKDCIYFKGKEENCLKVKETGGRDEKIYPFCGSICGYFELHKD